MEIPIALREKIINFLTSLPDIHNDSGQRALIYHAGLDGRLQAQIPFGGSLLQFSELILQKLLNYGSLSDGRNALEAFLNATKYYIGEDRKAECDLLLNELHEHLTISSQQMSHSIYPVSDEYVANLITSYDIARSVYTDLLFQHGIDKVYYYGSASNRDDKCDFIQYILPKNKTFDLPVQYRTIYDRINMIETGCELNAHVDLNYNRYFRSLEEAYKGVIDDKDRKIISRIIGMFQPYQKIHLPVLDVNSIKVVVRADKDLKEKIKDLDSLIIELKGTPFYKEYQHAVFDAGRIEDLSIIDEYSQRMRTHLKNLISYAQRLSTSLGSLIKINELSAYIKDDTEMCQKEFNPLILNMEEFHKKASLSALDRIMIR